MTVLTQHVLLAYVSTYTTVTIRKWSMKILIFLNRNQGSFEKLESGIDIQSSLLYTPVYNIM